MGHTGVGRLQPLLTFLFELLIANLEAGKVFLRSQKPDAGAAHNQLCTILNIQQIRHREKEEGAKAPGTPEIRAEAVVMVGMSECAAVEPL